MEQQFFNPTLERHLNRLADMAAGLGGTARRYADRNREFALFLSGERQAREAGMGAWQYETGWFTGPVRR